jgi:DnaA family protein
MSLQLPLSLGLKDSAVFANFVADGNAEAFAFLQAYPTTQNAPLIYIWGEPGCGKTHLLQALCQTVSERGDAAVYLPMRMVAEFPREALNGLEQTALICIDDIDAVAGDVGWEDALLRLYVRAHGNGCALAIAGNDLIGQLGLKLPQLSSRLQWGLAFQLKTLDNDAKLKALELRAKRRGVKLPPDSARYLLKHYGEASGALFDALDQLDKASLAAKRRLTIPFIRSVLTRTNTVG